MNQLPDKIVALYPPVITNEARGRFVYYAGSGYTGFPVDENFTHEDAMSRWVKKEFKTESSDSSEHKTWSVQNSKKTGYYTVSNIQGTWSCTCPAGMYHRRDCRHIKEIKDSL